MQKSKFETLSGWLLCAMCGFIFDSQMKVHFGKGNEKLFWQIEPLSLIF
jgi:hypothetical protein